MTNNQTVSGKVDLILQAMAPFLAAITDPDFSRAAQDPGACNFVAGNPQEIASPEYVKTLRRWAEPEDKDWFGYKMAHPPAMSAAAEGLSKELGAEFDPDDIVLTRGAHGGLAAVLSTVVDPNDEVIFVSPPWFFYEAMILGAGGRPVRVKVNPDGFDLDLEALAAAITPKTRVILINTPNNPTGRIYPEATLERLADMLEAASKKNGRPIYILSDESYSRILFDDNKMITPARFYRRTFLIHTYSKTALAPGQRVGFVAMPPAMPHREDLRMAFLATALATGNMLPDAIMQYALPEIETMMIDLADLQAKRDKMVAALGKAGYEVHTPEATFYLLVRSPIPDDIEFTRMLREKKVLVLPGRAVEMPGYFRISLTATNEMIDRALPVFSALNPASFGDRP